MTLQQKIIAASVAGVLLVLLVGTALVVSTPGTGGSPAGGAAPSGGASSAVPVSGGGAAPIALDSLAPGARRAGPRSMAEITLDELRLDRKKYFEQLNRALTGVAAAQERLIQAQKERDAISLRVDSAEGNMTQVEIASREQLKRDLMGYAWRKFSGGGGDLASAAPSGPWVQKAQAWRELSVARRQYNIDEPRAESGVRAARDALRIARSELETAKADFERYELELEKRERTTP